MQDYNTIIGAIQMRLNKCPTRSVMDRFRIGSSTLNLIMSRYKAFDLTIDELEAMSPKEVEKLFYPQKNLQRKEVPLPDFQYYYDRIHAPNSRVNISFCWLDYKEKNPEGYEKSQFYEYYQRFVQEKDDLVLQSTFSDLEDFYDTIVLPPPARKPKGKPTVENHVRYLETHLIEKLKEKIYTSFEDLNADIKKIVAVLNARPFQNQAFSRQEMFIKYDKPCMKPLPGGEYTTCDYKAVLKVPNNYHMPQRANTDLRQSRYRDFYKKNLTLGKAIINEIPVVTENIEDYLEKRHQELIEDNS